MYKKFLPLYTYLSPLIHTLGKEGKGKKRRVSCIHESWCFAYTCYTIPIPTSMSLSTSDSASNKPPRNNQFAFRGGARRRKKPTPGTLFLDDGMPGRVEHSCHDGATTTAGRAEVGKVRHLRAVESTGSEPVGGLAGACFQRGVKRRTRRFAFTVFLPRASNQFTSCGIHSGATHFRQARPARTS